MEVIITVKAQLMDGHTVQDITRSDVLCCDKAEIIHISTIEDIAKTKNELKRIIIDTMCNITEMDESDLYTKKRDADKVCLRFAVAVLLHSTNRFSLVEIGRILGGRDHTSVIHAIRSVKNRIETKDERFKPFYEAMRKTQLILDNK